jgi:hypothetical protein
VKLRALKAMGRTRVGDTFYRNRTDANTLVALRVAELAPEQEQLPLDAPPPPTGDPPSEEAPRRTRRSYRRRDMTPEE